MKARFAVNGIHSSSSDGRAAVEGGEAARVVSKRHEGELSAIGRAMLEKVPTSENRRAFEPLTFPSRLHVIKEADDFVLSPEEHRLRHDLGVPSRPPDDQRSGRGEWSVFQANHS